ncbi:unnamed protein product [Parascedosporium putredinis]|uniref:Heterokaryon incompatibility domain-containing protein n=1 Tax=Parascedosporium putredinis TaxID=1442378 RepID=A0A9P1H044_9PEZI|nr:unnamed protein product [Parascedosporium putredinis]CAI7993531.1 unnamed protein product [Parascedosporium putredinis]
MRLIKLCRGIPWAVSANLFSALVHLRETFSSAYLWIDALCINQDDVIERQAQVPIMDKIYRKADQVIIWLGPSTDTSEEVLRLVRQVANLGSKVIEQFGADLHADCLCHHQLPHPTADIWHRYLEFYDQRWFHRSWIIQEAVLAQPGRSIVHWGPWTMPWSEVLAGSQIFLPDRLRKAIFSRTDPHTLHSSPVGRNALRIGLIAAASSDLIAILKLVAGTSLDSSSDPVEVLWRTMIWDVYGHGHTVDEHPAPASLEDAFLTSLIPVLQDGPAEQVAEAKVIITSLLQRLSSSRPLSTTRKLHQVICYASTRTDHEWYKAHNGADYAPPEADKYSSYASGVTWSQRLFALDNGLLAMGPQSGVAGDEAWIISGCPFPMILRPSGPQGEYRVLGRSYIHGFMHGEGAPDDDHAWRWVCLV